MLFGLPLQVTTGEIDANRIAEDALEQLLEHVKIDVTERHLAGLLCSLLYEKGALYQSR